MKAIMVQKNMPNCFSVIVYRILKNFLILSFLLLVKRNSKLFTNLISVEQVRKNVFATLNKI